jgi:hypothetical protein
MSGQETTQDSSNPNTQLLTGLTPQKFMAAAVPGTQVSGANPPPLTASQLQQVLSGLTVGQEENPTGGIASNFAKSLAQLPASQAQSLMKALSGTGTFGTDVESDVAGTGGTPANNDANLATQTLNSYLTASQPFLANEQAQGQQAIDQYGTAIQQALKGASPQMQQAYSLSAPAMQQAMSMENTAATQNAENMPDFEALISGLTTEAQNQKAAQYAAIEEPYIASTQGVGSTGATSPGMNATNQNLANYYANLYQQALAGQVGQPSLTPASTTANTGVTSNLLTQYTNPATYAG